MKPIAILMSLVLALVGCAASPATFYKNVSNLSDTQICKTDRVAERSQDPRFRQDVDAEMNRRGLTSEKCRSLIARQRIGIGALIVVAAAAAAAASSSGGGGGGGGAPASNYASSDYEWDWDIFSEYGVQKVACRGVQTGQFADNWHCSGKLVNDNRWPGPN
jgi:hypothetical protein